MTTIILLAVASLTLILSFALDLQKEGKSSKKSIWIRSVVLALSLAGLGIEQFKLQSEKKEAVKAAEELHKALNDLRASAENATRNTAGLARQTEELKQNTAMANEKLATYIAYGPGPVLDTGPHGVIQFGKVAVNGTVTRGFMARNVGGGRCAVDITITDRKGSAGFTTDRTHIDLPGQTHEDFKVTFRPSASGPYEAELMIRGTAPCAWDSPTLVGEGQ